ncbi:hypothetical protein AGMMS49940_05080 [Spirochaetia bacterium]|nr:hypothetical protein AGMMS49940_05080 [Spirochaetia bacterium]
MEYEIKVLAPAVADLDSIITYSSQFYPSTPKKFLDALEKVKLNLQDMPYMYPVYEKQPIYRKVVVLNYLVFYTVDDGKRLVNIHRILPGAWDIGRHLLT